MASATSFYDFKPLDSMFPSEHTAITLSLSPLSNALSLVVLTQLSCIAERAQEVDFADYKGKVVLIVNTASKCGMTPQYAGLETLYKKLKEKYGDDIVFLGFPCNQFAGQEPGTDDEIQNFCQINCQFTCP
jgi:glutathione peroxidase-family protein